MALLEVKQLTKHFGGLTAVGDVTLELNEGELVGLIGLKALEIGQVGNQMLRHNSQ